MNITINSQILAQELRLLSKVVPTKSTLPVLTHVLVRASDQLYLDATDLQISLSTSCAASIQELGDVTLPAKKLLDILEQIPDQPINIATDKAHVRISAGSYKSRIPTFNAADFPKIPAQEGEISSLPAKPLATIIDRTIYAISDSSTQYVLQGALLSLHEGVFALVATDGKRLSIATASYAGKTTASYVIPEQALSALSSHAGTGQQVDFSCNNNHLFFTVGKRLLSSRMLEGKFPAYERVIPKGCDKRASVDRQGLAAALRRVVLMAEDKMPAVECQFRNGELTLVSKSAEAGEADEQLPMLYEGPDLDMSVNGKYVLDFLDRSTQKNVTIDLKSITTPMLFTDGPDFINVILGMR